jgi:protein TonB
MFRTVLFVVLVVAPAVMAQTPDASNTSAAAPTPSKPAGAPHWVTRPSAEVFEAAYPEAAERRGISGAARMRCKVTEKGSLKDCAIETEAPAGWGFGAATLGMAKYFRLSETTSGGRSVAEAVIQIPIILQLPGNQPAPPLPPLDPVKSLPPAR